MPGRTDATEEHTDGESFEWLRPVVDTLRNYHDEVVKVSVAPEHLFLDKARLLALTAPEWTALTGGLKVLNVVYDGSQHGVFTDRPSVLANDFFRVLTSMDHEWEPKDGRGQLFDINDRASGETTFTAAHCDLVFRSNSQLRSIAEVYASADGHERLVRNFAEAWHKVRMLDRFDVPEARMAAVKVC